MAPRARWSERSPPSTPESGSRQRTPRRRERAPSQWWRCEPASTPAPAARRSHLRSLKPMDSRFHGNDVNEIKGGISLMRGNPRIRIVPVKDEQTGTSSCSRRSSPQANTNGVLGPDAFGLNCIAGIPMNEISSPTIHYPLLVSSDRIHDPGFNMPGTNPVPEGTALHIRDCSCRWIPRIKGMTARDVRCGLCHSRPRRRLHSGPAPR